MLPTLIALGLSPLLVAVSALAGARWGPAVGGVASAFPAIVGPVLVIDAIDHGPAFTAHAADGTLLGLAALAAFVLAYGRAALAWGWRRSLAVGWTGAALAGTAIGLLFPHGSSPAGLLVGLTSLSLAYALLQFGRAGGAEGRGASAQALDQPPATPLWARMVLTTGLVGALGLAAGLVGPLIGGMLAALPVLASVLAVFAHRESGPQALIALLRGMLAGMAGFVAFCETIAVAVGYLGLWAAFLAATAAAVLAQLLVILRYLAASAGRTRARAGNPAAGTWPEVS